MEWTHTLVLAQARAHLAALADQAPSLEASSAYERVLIDLDRIHGDLFPDFEPIGAGVSSGLLYSVAVGTLEYLLRFGVDALHVELLLAELDDARALELR